MKAIVLYELTKGIAREKILEVFPRHKAYYEKFADETGKLLGIGTYENSAEGAMGIFTDKEAAEAFIKEDPFVAEQVVGKVTIKMWNDIL